MPETIPGPISNFPKMKNLIGLVFINIWSKNENKQLFVIENVCQDFEGKRLLILIGFGVTLFPLQTVLNGQKWSNLNKKFSKLQKPANRKLEIKFLLFYINTIDILRTEPSIKTGNIVDIFHSSSPPFIVMVNKWIY